MCCVADEDAGRETEGGGGDVAWMKGGDMRDGFNR